ncbi:hypothetical protein HYALB_00010418 [Hymenoscyphus albidus]|uniref:Uncharacterized protein n=1 Tax=Hymenoscyphus albidus TaxID=595503 RepID=A0A9N9M1L4_9HELO|nr:hypothetical protein HYALB_00010418 [Hymenoscyphus albidus]
MNFRQTHDAAGIHDAPKFLSSHAADRSKSGVQTLGQGFGFRASRVLDTNASELNKFERHAASEGDDGLAGPDRRWFRKPRLVSCIFQFEKGLATNDDWHPILKLSNVPMRPCFKMSYSWVKNDRIVWKPSFVFGYVLPTASHAARRGSESQIDP